MLQLVDSGKAKARIVVSTHPELVERHAAKELNKYVRMIVRGNAFRRAKNEKSPSVTDAAVVTVADAPDTGSFQDIEGNYIEGWTHSITCTSILKSHPHRFLIRDNTIDGGIHLPGRGYRKIVQGNVNPELAAEPGEQSGGVP